MKAEYVPSSFNANDFVPYIQSGARVVYTGSDMPVEGRIGVVVGDRIPFEKIEEALRHTWPLRKVFFEETGQTYALREDRLKISV